MSKKWIVAAAIGCGACAMMVAGKRQGAKPRPDKWAKMRQFMEDMPEDFPPRVMFDNLATTRENTERILAILERSEGSIRPEESELTGA